MRQTAGLVNYELSRRSCRVYWPFGGEIGVRHPSCAAGARIGQLSFTALATAESLVTGPGRRMQPQTQLHFSLFNDAVMEVLEIVL